jgi:hypothetical protein
MWKVRQVFDGLFSISRPSDLTAAMTADMAAAVSPISGNPTWVVGIGRLFCNPVLVAKLRKK